MLKTMESENTVKELSHKNNEPEWLLNKRLAAYHLFRQKLMPNFIYGLNINLNININLDELESKNPGIAERNVISSNKSVKIYDLNGILKNNESVLKEKFMTNCVPATDKFTAFHNTFANNILLVYVPKNTEVKEPIEIITNVGSKVLFDHLIIVVDDNSKLALVEDINSKNDDEKYISKIVEIFVGDNSNLDYGNLQMLDKNSFNFTIKRAVIGKDSSVNWLDCCFGSNITLSEVTTYLNKQGATTNNYGIFFGNESQQFDLVANSIHNAPNTVSDIFTKGALTDKAKCVYRGLVRIEKNASGSNGYQKEDTLLLSQDAAADSIPNLEIENSDVRCTHGASIGRIDREKMFYLKSRGLDEKEATRTYVKGFFEELIQKMRIENLKESMHELIEQKMQ